MGIKFSPTALPGVLLVEPEVFPDPRGSFMEFYHREKYRAGGILSEFVQDNVAVSTKNVLRGLHFQVHRPQAKLVAALSGSIFDVAVDLRPDSPTFRHWVGEYLSGENRRQLFIPEGFAHGYCVLSERAEVFYKCSALYRPEDDRGILWSDPQIGIEWPLKDPLLSAKDAALPELALLFRRD